MVDGNCAGTYGTPVRQAQKPEAFQGRLQRNEVTCAGWRGGTKFIALLSSSAALGTDLVPPKGNFALELLVQPRSAEGGEFESRRSEIWKN